MARYAVGDIQGCHDELCALLERIRFSADRDELWLVGDLVNRGPRSLEVLRFVRALGANAVVVLGNHDLHLLALALDEARGPKKGDTLDAVLAAPDRDALLEWLLALPLAHHDARRGDLLIHGGLVPQWTAAQAAALAGQVQQALRTEPRALFRQMYGDRPDSWSESLQGIERLRFVINVLTRMRFCTAEGRIDLKLKGGPEQASGPWRPWFEFAHRASRDTRVIFGHWSALGYHRADNLVALDSGCVWGGALTAVDLDDADRPPVALPCAGYSSIE